MTIVIVTDRVAILAILGQYTIEVQRQRSTTMPPRRSSRVAIASLEVSSEIAPVKRKREQTADSAANDKEKESKPSLRTRRSSRSTVASTSKSSSALKSKKSLPEIVETNNEEQADAPPLKKARPSAGADADGDIKIEEENSEGKPKRGRRAAASRPVGDVGIDEEVLLKPLGRRTSARSVNRKLVDDDGIPQELGDVDDERHIRKGRKPKLAPARKASNKVAEPVTIDKSDDELEPPPPAQPKPISNRRATTQEVADNEEGQEEAKSLLVTPVHNPSLSQHVPEEPSAPKSRLVIHKIVLVNFKSYAGRQEIGPFHKVASILDLYLTSLTIFRSRFLPLSVLMVLGNQTQSMRCYLCLDIGLPRCDRERSPNLYTTLPTTQTLMNAV